MPLASPQQEKPMKAGDTLTPEQAKHIDNLHRLCDMLNDCVSSGRLSEADIPDDFQALTAQMDACNHTL